MDNEFKTILAFLGEPAEVGGRSIESLPEGLREKIQSFASGNLPESERGTLFEFLKEHPDWIAHLAEAIQKSENPT